MVKCVTPRNTMRSFLVLLTLCLVQLNSSAAPPSGKLKIFILAGQSNMQGHAKLSTFEHIGMDPATAPMLADMLGTDGKPKICERVWITSIGCAGDDTKEQTGKLTAGFGASSDKIGPEFTFGLTMEKLTSEPILLIKTAWGGKSLNTDFRPPSAGPYAFNEVQLEQFQKQGKDVAVVKAEKTAATGIYYRLMIQHVKRVIDDLNRVVPSYDPAKGYELAGFAWFQGWNDMVDGSTYPHRDKPGGYDEYSTVLAHFIQDVRRDLNAPKLPFAIGVFGVGGPTSEYGPHELRYKSTHQNFRDAMAAPATLPHFQGNVTAVLTEKYWDLELKAALRKDSELKDQAKRQAKDAGLKPAEEKAALDQLRTANLSDRERKILEVGISNFEFHYLGSAKILGRIGKGLSEALK